MGKLYVLVLDPNSLIGSTPAIREPDGELGGLPYWYCSAVDASGPLLRVEVESRVPARPQETRPRTLSVYLPYSAVAAIAEHLPGDSRFGFSPP